MAKVQEMSVRGPFKIPGRKSYYVEVNRKRRSLGTSDKKIATGKVRQIKAEIKDQAKANKQKKVVSSTNTFDQFMKQYVDWAEKVQPVKTWKANRLSLRKLLPYCEGVSLSEIGAFHMDQMIAECFERGRKVGAVNCYIRHAKSVFNQAVKWKMVDANPFNECKQLRKSQKPPKAMEKHEIDALLSSIYDCYDYLLIRAYLVTGRSRAELVRLDWEEIDFNNARYYITRTKTHLSKWYPMGQEFIAVLEALGREESGPVFWRRYHPDTITHKVKDYMRGAGVGKYSLHCLRHSFARIYLDTGGSIYALQQLMGHSQVSTTSVYSSLSTGKMAQEIERVTI